MNIFSMMRRARLMKPEGDDGGAGGAAVVDRGDTLAAGSDDPNAIADAAAAAQAAADEEARLAAELAGKTDEVDPDAPKEGETAEQTAARKAGKPAMIPVERHKAMLDKAREERDALAAQLANQQKGATIVATNEQITGIETKVIEKEAEYNQALIDGDTAKATALMREIRGMERQMGDLKTTMASQAAETRAIEQVRYDTVVERLEAAYPALNPDAAEFDKGQVAEVMELQTAYKLTGLGAAAALQKAVKLIMGAATTAQKTAATTTPRVSTEDAAAAVAAAARTEAATTKALDAAKRTPASAAAAKLGVDSDKLGGGQVTAEMVMKMDQAKFAKLDEADLARMRGDEI